MRCPAFVKIEMAGRNREAEIVEIAELLVPEGFAKQAHRGEA